MTEFADLKGKILVSITCDTDALTFCTLTGETFVACHRPECCEDVHIEDITGDLNDLLIYPILVAEERTSTDAPPEDPEYPGYTPDSYTWTFYELATIKGSVTIRWFGSSNGYYSETVDFERLS